ncbi:MAG: Ig-like domain-containing protein [Leptospirales bacterium]
MFRPYEACSRVGMTLLFIGTILFSGCQGNNMTFPPGTSSGSSSALITGTTFDGPVIQANVTLEQFPSGSGAIGTATTNANGTFSMTVPLLDPNGIYIVSVTNGKTIDLASGTTISFAQGDQLSAMGTGSDFNSGSFSVTPFTTLEATLATTFIQQGESPQAALIKSGSLWTGFLGFDPVKTTVDDPTGGPTQATPAGLYGLDLAGLSQLADNIGQSQSLALGTANTLGLLSQLESDLSDGKLNGMALGSATPLSYYGYTLTADTLRKSLAAGILEFLWNARNKSGLTPTQISGSANSLALNTSSLFPGGSTPTAPDPGSPTLLVQSPQNNLYYNGSLLISATASDDLGIGNLVLSSPDVPLPGGNLYGNPLITSFNTATLPDGPYTLIFSATDYAGNNTAQTIPFSIDNTPPAISNLSPATGTPLVYCQGSNVAITVKGILTDNGSGPKYLRAQETSPQSTTIPTQMIVVSNTEDHFSFGLSIPSNTTCQTINYNFNLTGYDNLNNSSTLSYTLTIRN